LVSSLFLDVKQRRLLVIDVSGQPNGPIFKGQGVEETSLITGQRFITSQKNAAEA